jgi:hypothetical protein
MNNRTEFIKLSDAAKKLNMPNASIRRLAIDGKIPAFKAGPRRWMVDVTALKNKCYLRESAAKTYVIDRVRRLLAFSVVRHTGIDNLAIAEIICDDYGTGIVGAVMNFIEDSATDLVIIEGSALPSIIVSIISRER